MGKSNQNTDSISTERVAIRDYPHVTELEEIFTEKLSTYHFEFIHNNFEVSKDMKEIKQLEKYNLKPKRENDGSIIAKIKSKIYYAYDWISRKITTIDSISIMYFFGYSTVLVLSPLAQKAIIGKLGLK